ncbi:succinate dehydrogenase [ubiquinone] cytochrome b small subunit, mitochondrial [Leptidea sinapis]|uniref:succinate dehydrogenase [ubiquinone] cytochrome b small subunit, mitochondrial n=1 Tax=Leptidea sinapis TaxID=189913 RepID=UPI0021282737|nr:succinate dehydrogenase [ubiquinone] cytochrome b small subunit, mitochondrial [Leptidea sinapis]
MAFSMFLRRPACTTRLLSQQLVALSKPTHCSLNPKMIASIAPLQNSLLKSETPISNVIRSFKSSTVHEEHPHDHSKLWVIEKLTSAAMVPLIPICLMMPNKIFDSILAILITAHSFWGLEAIAVDYVRASIFGPILPKIAIGLVYLISIATLGGLFYIITHDVGLANAIKQLWAVKAKQNA